MNRINKAYFVHEKFTLKKLKINIWICSEKYSNRFNPDLIESDIRAVMLSHGYV